MDGHRFDTLARSLAKPSSRRGGLRLLAATGAALLALARGKSEVAAQDLRTFGEPCWDDDQCFGGSTTLYCADNGFPYDGDLNCCAYEGGRCYADEHCCGALVCSDSQVCRALAGGSGVVSVDPNPPVSWAGVGSPCQSTSDCNRSRTGSICEYTDSTGDKRCCWYEGSECSFGAQCCGSRVCLNGVCQFPGGGSRGGNPNDCTWEGCACMLYRDPACRASCPLYDPCDGGLRCTATTSEEVGTCVPA